MVRIAVNQKHVAAFCRKNQIRRLWFFGSVLRDDFRPDSDVDVLVDFEPDASIGLSEFLDAQEEVQALVGRPVDLVERRALRNPFRRHEILRTAEVLFAA